MNFVVKHDSVDISDHVIEYSRFQFICTGIGTIDVILENINLNRTIIPWDKIELWEEGNKVGKYIISSVIKSAEGGTLTLQCQDYSKKLVEHFVTDTNIVDYPTTTKYWIEKFLQEADLSYEFTVEGDGEIVGPNASYGMSSAYDLIISLLQQTGWYIYFDQNGKAIVGTLEKAGDSYDGTINDDDILSLERNRNDQRLRNRAVIWGSYDPMTGAWIEADVSVNTPWNYDSHDKRAVVLSNGMIYSTLIAEDLARKILNEFSKIGNEIVVEIINHYDIDLGDRVFVRSKHFNGRLMVTTIESTGNRDGLKVKLTLNQKCPRLFAYFATLGDFIPVYIGTSGAGVWKKYTGSSTWTSINTGLEDLYIVDLFVKQGILACIASDGYLYTSDIISNVWTKFHPGDLIDLDVNLYYEPESMLDPKARAVCCSIDDTGNIVVGYVYNDPEDLLNSRSWIVTISGTNILRAEQIILDPGGEQGIRLIDLEAIGYIEENNIASITKKPAVSGTSIPGTKRFQVQGTAFYPTGCIDPNAYCVGPSYSGVFSGSSLFPGGNNFRAGFIVESDDTCWYCYKTSGYRLIKADLTTLTVLQSYNINNPSSEMGRSLLYKYSPVIFNFIHFAITGGNWDTIKVNNYSYTLGNSDFTLADTVSESVGYQIHIIGQSIQNHIAVCSYYTQPSANIYRVYRLVYDVLSHSFSNTLVSELTFNTLLSDNTINNYQRFYYICRGTGVDTGLFYWKRHWTISGYPTIELRVLNSTIGSYGTQQQVDKILKTWSSDSYNSIEVAFAFDVFWSDFGGYDYSKSVASDTNYAYYFGETALRKLSWDTEENISIVSIIRFPDLTFTSDEFIYDPSIGYSDLSGLHLFGNTALIYGSTLNTWGVSSRTKTPLLIRPDICNPDYSEHFIFIINPLHFSSSQIVINDYFTVNGVQGPLIGVGAFRDDATGHFYLQLTARPSVGVNGDTGLYGFTATGVNTRKITNYSGPADIVKTYAMGSTVIKKFESINSLEITPQILKHTSYPFDPGLIGASVDALEQTYGVYEVILEPDEVSKVEISKGSPTVVYSTPNISGSVTVPPTAYLAASLTNLVNDFYLPPPHFYNFYDARVFDIPSPHLFYVEQGGSPALGILPEALLERYVGLAVSGELTIIKYDFTGQFYPVTSISGSLMTVASGIINPSGAITTFETTNYTLDPYLFIGISGPPTMFFQRNPLGMYFYSYSSTLPSGVDITVIRVDDDI